MAAPKKSLGQHWLKDRAVLTDIADFAGVNGNDTVLEIGPGQGYLTSVLLNHVKKVVAVEIDADLAKKLPGQFPGKDLTVVNGDFIGFNLNNLPVGYKVVANIPYYVTARVVRTLLTAANKPASVTLLVQKEVAQRLAAEPGDMSILSVSAQFYSTVTLGPVVPAKFFTPPPKVDSQVVRLDLLQVNDLQVINEKAFFKLVRIGFSNKRKKLASNLAASYQIDKQQVERIFEKLNFDAETRAQDLSLQQWAQLLSVDTWQI